MNFKEQAKPGDVHIVTDASSESMKCFDYSGKLQWSVEAHTYGQHPDWKRTNGDTPRGMYVVGVIYDTAGEVAYGDYCVDLVDLENQERGNGRDGISIHGGGSASPRPFAEKQGWYATHGCIRVQNGDMRKHIHPTLVKVKALGRRVFVTVQD